MLNARNAFTSSDKTANSEVLGNILRKIAADLFTLAHLTESGEQRNEIGHILLISKPRHCFESSDNTWRTLVMAC